MSKENYTPAFNAFWKAYPRKVSKAPAFKAWQKNVDEQDAFLPKAIVDDVEKRTRMHWWSPDKSKIPHAATWLNQKRWEDEDWEDDVKTRGANERTAKPSTGAVNYKPIESEYDFDSWQQMQNRIMRSYLWVFTMTKRKLDDSDLQQLIDIKSSTYRELIPAINEEIDAADDKRQARGSMAQTLVETMVARFDKALGVQIADRVIEQSRRIRQQGRAA